MPVAASTARRRQRDRYRLADADHAALGSHLVRPATLPGSSPTASPPSNRVRPRPQDVRHAKIAVAVAGLWLLFPIDLTP